MTFYEYFDRVWIISLTDRLDRRRRIERELARIGLPLKPGKIEFFDAIRTNKAEGFRSAGSRGCVMSHSAVLDLGRLHGCRRMLTLEDDVVFRPDFNALQTAAIKALENAPDWGLVNFGHYTRQPMVGTGLLAAPRDVCGTHFYATHGSAIARLKTWFDRTLDRPVGHPDGGRISADGAVNHFRWANSDIPAFLYMPKLGKQCNSASDISRKKWFDHIPLAGQFIRTTRDLLPKQGNWE